VTRFSANVFGGFGKLHRTARTWFVRPAIDAALFPCTDARVAGFNADSSRLCRTADGHRVAPLDLDLGEHPLDKHVDRLPYDFDRHVRLALYGYAVTSIGIVVTKRG
jgi:hypothetical protein